MLFDELVTRLVRHGGVADAAEVLVALKHPKHVIHALRRLQSKAYQDCALALCQPSGLKLPSFTRHPRQQLWRLERIDAKHAKQRELVRRRRAGSSGRVQNELSPRFLLRNRQAAYAE